MNFFISRLFFPLSIAGTLASFLYARHTGGNLGMAVILPSVTVLLIAMLLERFRPFHPDWNRSRDDVKTDLASVAALFGIVDPFLKWIAPVIVVAVYGHFPGVGQGAFPDTLPFAPQLMLATLIAEFASYWSHRLHHTNEKLWWLHALHHGSKRLYTLNNFRVHPLNYVINYFVGIFPLILLGMPQDVILGYFALSLPVLMLQHANLDFRSGLLNYIFSTNEIHRWHHSAQAGEGDTNFGRAFVMWDLVFGTFRYRPRGNMPDAIGLYVSSNYPAHRSFVGQIVSMFSPNCCRA